MKIMKCLFQLAAVLTAAALGFWTGLSQTPKDAPVFSGQHTQAENTLENYRTERNAAYAQEKAQLREIAYASGAEAEIAALAQKRLLEIAATEQAETKLEGCLKLRGMEAAVFVNEYLCCVFVDTELLTSQQGSIISQLVCAETGLGNDNVKIIPMNYGNF